MTNPLLLAASGAAGEGQQQLGGAGGVWSWLRQRLLRLLSSTSSRGWQAGACYVLFVLAFAVDFSLLMLVYVLGMLLVALLSQGKARSFWMVLLVYTEVGPHS